MDLQQLLPKVRSDIGERVVLAVVTSIRALFLSATHPYVVDKVKKVMKPLLVVAAVLYAVGFMLLLPFKLLDLLSLGYLPLGSFTDVAHSLLLDGTAFIPMATILLLRSVVQKPLWKCFQHMLREVNPGVAKRIDEASQQFGAKGKEARHSRAALRNPDEPPPRTYNMWDKALRFLLVSVGIYTWRKVPVVGFLASPVAHYFTMGRTLGGGPAAVLSAAALVPAVEPWALRAAELWRASLLLGQELLDPYVSACVDPAQRAKFWRRQEVVVVAFMAPQALLLQLRFLGPLLFLPMCGAAAWLVDLCERQRAERAAEELRTGREQRAAAAAGVAGGSGSVPRTPGEPPHGAAVKRA